VRETEEEVGGTGAGERNGRTLLLGAGAAGFSAVPSTTTTSIWSLAAGVLTGEEEGEEEEEEKKLEALDTATWNTSGERRRKIKCIKSRWSESSRVGAEVEAG
jgi:hypothetical protein